MYRTDDVNSVHIEQMTIRQALPWLDSDDDDDDVVFCNCFATVMPNTTTTQLVTLSLGSKLNEAK